MRQRIFGHPDGRRGAGVTLLRRLAWAAPALILLCAGARATTPALAANLLVTITGSGVTGSAGNFTIAAPSGQTTVLSAVATGASCQNPIYQYTWTFNNQSIGSGPTISTVFTQGGTGFVIATSCNSADSGSATFTVTIGGASAGGSCTPNPAVGNPISVQVIASLSSAPNQSVSTAGTGQSVNFVALAGGGAGGLTYAWSFGDGSTSSALAINNASHSYGAAGNFTVTATVADSGGHVNCGTLALTITGSSTGGGTNPKISVAPNGPYSGAVSQAIAFGGFAQTFNSGATITGYSWSFGDGSVGSGQSVSHAYSSAGTYTVTLTATDSTGQSGSNTTTATIGGSGSGSGSGQGTTGQNSERGVTVNTGGPYNGSPGATITFNGTATTTNAGASITSYTWNFGDNSTPGTGQSTTHTYASAGNYTLTLTVTDSTGVAVAATAIVAIGGSGGSSTPRTIQLVTGCNNVSLTFPDNTPTGTVGNGVTPSAALLSVWKLVDPATSKYKAFFPGATQASDLPTVNRLDAVFICVNASATFTEPGA